MAAGDTTQGTLVVMGASPFWEWPNGAYGLVVQDGKPAWRARTPNGLHGDLSGHDVIAHDDGTITVSPSILVRRPPEGEWHGYLERGVWREV